MKKLKEKRIAEEVETILAIKEKMHDAFVRQNQFDMMSLFDEQMYYHVTTLKDVCEYDDDVEALETLANDIALDDGLAYSITHDVLGRDLGEERRNMFDKKNRMIEENMELIKKLNGLLGDGLDRIKKQKNRNTFLKGMVAGEAICIGVTFAKRNLPKVFAKVKTARLFGK